MDMISMEMVWLAVLVAALIVEAVTVGLTSIWVAGGALAALLAALAGATLNFQLLLFFGTVFAMLYWTRPIAVKYLNSRRARTNIDEMTGAKVRVLERIDNTRDSGRVNYKGMEWTARSDDDSTTFEADEMVTVLRIEGVKMIVGNAPQQSDSPVS